MIDTTAFAPLTEDLQRPLYDSLRRVATSTTFVPSFLVFIVVYHFLAPLYRTKKQLSWVLTTVASATMVIASMPFVWDYVLSGGNVRNVRAHIRWAYTACRMFQAYLVADLIMGVRYYREHVHMVTGWIHHVVYVIIVELAVRRAWTHIFCLCLLMELPTFILAVASLYPHLRSNTLFAVSFFLTRIALHIILCVSFFRSRGSPAFGGSATPAAILACVFPLHAMWFRGCVRGFIKRAKERKEKLVVEEGAGVKAAEVVEGVAAAVETAVAAAVPSPVPSPAPSSIRARQSVTRKSRIQQQQQPVATLDIKSTKRGVVFSVTMPGALYALY